MTEIVACPTSLTLLTDLYQVTMAYGYYKAEIHETEAVFHLFFRKPPFGGGFAIAAGLEAIIDYLENYRFSKNDLDYLASLKGGNEEPLFSGDFFAYLKQMRFSCDLLTVPEGTVMFPHEPILRIQGPLIQCQLLETPLLTLFNFSSLIATKAARVCLAAKGDPVIDFGLRRAQGIDGGLTAARSAYVGGCEGTSNVLAGKLYGIPVKGTHSHSWVMVFDDEMTSFRTYIEHLPANSILLVDTYNTIEGVKKAIECGRQLKERGHRLEGVRLDSGDLAYLSIQARDLLDEAGFFDTKVVASNELDEHVISELKRQGAKIDIWGVGTKLVTAKDHPALDGVYKVSAIRAKDGGWKYKLKLSEQMAKISNPGILQVRRFSQKGQFIADVVYDIYTKPEDIWEVVDPFDATRRKKIPADAEGEDILIPIFEKGERIYAPPRLDIVRERTQTQLSRLHTGTLRFLNPHPYVMGLERHLYNMKIELVQNIRTGSGKSYLVVPE